jgi:hypothetical protein
VTGSVPLHLQLVLEPDGLGLGPASAEQLSPCPARAGDSGDSG